MLSQVFDVVNGCHVGWGATAPSGLPCEYGDTTSDVVIVITGDSHVAAWFGAFDEAGKANHWKIVTVTKRGCPIADVSVYSAVNRDVLDAPYPECDKWRENAVQYINDLQADLVVFPMLTRRGMVGYRGSDAIRRIMFNDKGTSKTLLQLIREKNTAQGKTPAPRADMRMGVGPQGQIFVLNKRDGIIRLLVPDSAGSPR